MDTLDKILHSYYHCYPVLKHCTLIDKEEAKKLIREWALGELKKKMEGTEEVILKAWEDYYNQESNGWDREYAKLATKTIQSKLLGE